MKNIVRRLRREKDLSQAELARELGITRPNLSNIERELQVPKAKLIFKISNYFGIPAEQVFFEDNVRQGKRS